MRAQVSAMYLFVINQIGLGARPTATLDSRRIRYSGDLSFAKPEDMPITKLTPEIITAAIIGFEEQKRHIDSQTSELKAMLSGGPTETAAATPEAAPRKRKKLSAATRRRMREAQRRRFAKVKSESEPPAPAATPEPPKPKHRISKEGMKRILAANKKRWALKRAEVAKAQSPVAKKSAPARKKAAVKKAAPAKATKKSAPVKKAVVKKSATATAQAVTEAGAQ